MHPATLLTMYGSKWCILKHNLHDYKRIPLDSQTNPSVWKCGSRDELGNVLYSVSGSQSQTFEMVSQVCLEVQKLEVHDDNHTGHISGKFESVTFDSAPSLLAGTLATVMICKSVAWTPVFQGQEETVITFPTILPL